MAKAFAIFAVVFFLAFCTHMAPADELPTLAPYINSR